jgi:Tol biopolymer transport system component
MERCEVRTLLSIAQVSVTPTGTAAPNGNSDFVATTVDSQGFYDNTSESNPESLSADGTKLVFVSDVADPVGNPDGGNPGTAVFVRDSTTGRTTLVSATPDGQPANGDSFDPAISPNGRYVAFVSLASNLTAVAGQTPGPNLPGVGDLYVRDLQTGTTTLLDQTQSGQASDGFSTGQFVFSPDSTTLAWVDTSDNLTTATLDPLSRPDSAGDLPTYVYVRNLAAQTTSLVSASTTGQASGNITLSATTDLVFSPDSQSLVFGSTATDLTANLPDDSLANLAGTLGWLVGESNPENLFLRNLATGTTTLLSVTTSGQLPVQGVSFGAVFSPDGKSVAFTSAVTDLTANGTDFTPVTGLGSLFLPNNIFIRDLTTATTGLVTATPSGLQSDGIAGGPVFSPDGSELAFTSSATDLTSNAVDQTPPPGGSQAVSGVPFTGNNAFVRDLAAGTTKLITVTPSGMLSSGVVSQIVFSPDGHYLAYTSDASDLTKNSLETSPVSVPGIPSNALGSVPLSISNVFVTNLGTGTTTLASPTNNGQLSNAIAGGLIFSPDSASLFFSSNAIDLTSNPPDTTDANPNGQSSAISNLFVRNLSAGTTSLISATTSGQLSDSTGQFSYQPSITAFLSPDGQTVYFDSDAPNLTPGDTNPDQSTEIFAASAPFTVTNQIQFQSWESSAQESDGSVVVTVLRSSPTTTAASVNYAVENGTATAGTDFITTSGTLQFAAGQASQTFTVPLIAADEFSGTRSAELVLSDPQGASLGYASATLNLTANTPAPAPAVVTPTSPPRLTPPAVTSTSPPKPGPVVVSVAPLKSTRGKTSLVITFNQVLDSASAENATNYQVTLPGRASHVGHRHQTTTQPRRPVAVAQAAYDPTTHEVTLTLLKKLRPGQAYQLQINGTAGGLTNLNGVALNSPDMLKPGADYLAAL